MSPVDFLLLCLRYGRQRHRKNRQAVPALRRDRPLMERDNLPGDGETQPGPTGAAPRIQPVKLLKDTLQFLLGNRSAVVGKSQLYAVLAALGFNGDLGSAVAVIHRIAQKVVKDSLHLVGATVQQNVLPAASRQVRPF